ncbi:hypothetical protein [Streptomyces sp. NBC_01262]|uniref:hypothetical protein n=1 Tax=Streptomyces sp. NBC_01262 TaxID=2903803 RepID=UPI002E36A5E2|nr:hypothetical protein [Streptomyces sp. NBC_01262]
MQPSWRGGTWWPRWSCRQGRWCATRSPWRARERSAGPGRPRHPPRLPVPAIAVDTTGGPTDQAASYTAQPGTRLGTLNWLCSFRSGYETVSGWVDGQWITRPGKN